MAQPGFWDEPERAQTLVQKKKLCSGVVEPLDAIGKLIEDGGVLLELGAEQPDAVEADLQELDHKIEQRLGELEFQLMLGGEHDGMNAIVTLQPGAGGVDASDWAEMLLRMYIKWAQKSGYQVEELDFQKAEEAGIKNVTIKLTGPYAYGRMKAEQGVHRLVRISPFDGQARRQTSFASVEVVPELDDTIKVEIGEKDLKIDTYRSSGAGGQHVNKTESAIRITHLPTGIVVTCQNERSQHKNRARAMALLQARLLAAEQEKRASAQARTRKLQVGSGDRSERIRTYNFPQGRMTDHRIDLTLYKLAAIMNGELDELLEALQREFQAEELAAE